jgi:ADP-heptose:LPS heptosyltransferase
LFGKEQLGIEVDDPRPNCFLTESEEREGEMIVSKYVNPVAIQITGASSPNKNWPLENWEELVSNNPDYNFIQLGLANEELVKGAVDLRGTSIRQAFAIVKASKAFVGIDSVFAHAAAAFHIPSVVLFGPETPAVWGYQWNQNLYNPPPCSPCLDVLLKDPCPYGKQCMINITVSQVENALRALSTATDTILDSASS